MRTNPILAGAVALGLAGAAGPALGADAATYDYLEARYTVFGDADTGPGSDADVTGLGLEGQRTFGEQLFVRMVSDMYNLDTSGSGETALDMFSVGPGIRVPLNTPGTATLWGTFNYERASVGSTAATGFGFDVGLRMQLTDRIEGGVTIKSAATDSGNVDVDYETWELEGAYSITRDIDITASLLNGEVEPSPGSDTDLENLIRVGVRLPF